MKTADSPSGWMTMFNTLFWIFNGTILLIVYLGFLPFMAPGFLMDLIAGNIPWNFVLPFVGLVGVPTTCSVLGVTQKHRQITRTSSFSLAHLFFGVEMPLLLFSVMRFFMLRDLTAASGLLLLIGVFGTITYVHWFISQPDADNPVADWLQLTGLTLAFSLAIYGLTLSVFFWPVVGMVILVLPYLLVVFPIGVLILGVLSAPFGIAFVYHQVWGQVMKRLSQRYGKVRVRGVAAGMAAVGVAAVILLQQQPQTKAFALLQTPPETPQAQQTLVKQSGAIRRGLLNAYLAQYRYLHNQNTQIIQSLYSGNTVTPGNFGMNMQILYNVVASPFTYQGDFQEDSQKAAALYGQFFDQPIQRAELPAIEKALNSTFNRTAAHAGLNDINVQRVWLAEQNITVTPHGDWADMELHEVYDNRTSLEEEVLYYFSLPESAVITGLWLGETPDLANRYRFVVSPGGQPRRFIRIRFIECNPPIRPCSNRWAPGTIVCEPSPSCPEVRVRCTCG